MAQKIYLQNGTASPDLQSLSKKEKDTAQWISRDTAYTVDFGNDSPFSKKKFDISAGGSTGSGAIKGNAAYRKHSYTLTQAGSAKAGDPDVEILP